MKKKKKIIIPNFYPIIVHIILYMNFAFRQIWITEKLCIQIDSSYSEIKKKKIKSKFVLNAVPRNKSKDIILYNNNTCNSIARVSFLIK